MINEDVGMVDRGMLQQAIADLRQSLENGEIQIPVPSATQVNTAGGTNHYPDSDIDYSTDAATVAGTLPGTAGDGNQEVWRHSRQPVGDDILVNAAHALKAVGHSLFAADEAVNTTVPIWDRVNGWVALGGVDPMEQYDQAAELLGNLVGPGDTWFILFRCVALDNTPVPAGVQAYFEIWEQRAADEGVITGGPFDLAYEIRGEAGTREFNYRVLAKTDSGVSVLSNVLNVLDVPDVLNSENYPKIFHNAGPGFIVYEIYREDVDTGIFYHLYDVRNSIDLQYNDTGFAHFGEVSGWPADPGNAPTSYAKTRTLRVGAYNGPWQVNSLRIKVPNTYDFSLTVKQFLRWGLTAPTATDRQIGIDRIWFSTTYNEWAPDKMPPFANGTFPIKSVSPTSGNQGTGGGVTDPPDPGSGGGLCIVTHMPVMVKRRRRMMVPFEKTYYSDCPIGHAPTPFEIREKRTGTASEFYRIRTKCGIRYECNAPHPLELDFEGREFIQAQNVEVGTLLAGKTLRGRLFRTPVTSVKLIPKPVKVGTWSLHDTTGARSDGKGTFAAGWSPQMDRALLSSNSKPEPELP